MLNLFLTAVEDTTVNISAGSGWFEWKVTVGDALTLLGIIIAIVEYGISSHKTRKQSLSSQKETWFLNVIVLPQLEGINKFYQGLLSDIEADKPVVAGYKQDNYKQCTLKVAELKQQRKKKINDFFDHVGALVMSYNEVLGREVNAIVMALEDIYVKAIDCYVKDENVDNIRAEVLQNKQHLIAKLNCGLKK